MNKVLSICIPSYNMEEYLGRCVESMLVSEVLDQLEIIIVNDGSKDKTLEIAENYRERYPQSIIVIDKPNGHYGSCINASLKVATGKFFRIVDADDWVDSDALVEFIKLVNQYDVDCVCTRFTTHFYQGGEEMLMIEAPFNTVLDLNHFTVPESCLHMHCLTYATDLLRRIEYNQTEGVCYTDSEYTYFPLSCSRNMIFLDLSLYQYLIGREGQSMDKSVIKKNNDHFIKVIEKIDKLHSSSFDFNSNEEHLWAFMQMNLFSFAAPAYIIDLDYNSTAETVLRKVMRELRKHGPWQFPDRLHNNSVRIIKLWYYSGIFSRIVLYPIKQRYS